MKRFKLISSFMFLVALVTIIIGCTGSVSAATDTYVTLDINPSVELIVNRREKVVYANALNEDGEVLLAELDLIGMDLDAAIELIIQTSIELGFIDVESEEVIVSITALAKDPLLGEKIRNKVKEHVNHAFENRGIIGRGQDKAFVPDFVAEAESYGVTPGFLFLVKAAMFADDELTLEVALEMEVSELQAIIKSTREEMKTIAQGLREEFLTAKEALITEFEAEKADLEAQIEAAEGDTTELENELAALIEAFKLDMATLRAEFLVESEALRLEYKLQVQARRQLHHEAVEDFLNDMEQRREAIKEQIQEFQNKRP